MSRHNRNGATPERGDCADDEPIRKTKMILASGCIVFGLAAMVLIAIAILSQYIRIF